MKKIIGIVPASAMANSEESSMKDHYRLCNNYIKRTVDAGGIPVGLAPCNGWLTEEALDICDGFLVQGGAEFYPYHFQVMHHAITRGKRYLGICLGEQLIYVYLKLRSIVEERGYEGDLIKAMCDYVAEQSSDFTLQRRIDGHCYEKPPRGKEDDGKHWIKIVPKTLMHRVLGKDRVFISSFHRLCTPTDQDLVTINAWSEFGDGVVEGTEYGENILGIQGHPEVDGTLPELFDFLCK
ncbi:MAG: gamma-glutamyl-gamma-aminobutyrate hydrolase family protein [Clostridia bacterium]|nr:gamma-glutamyl-gamma-aminobutyrate hydrolase family protein [Clostridia bacterium]